MKKLITIFMAILLINVANSQNMLLHKTGGTVVTLKLSELDSITFVTDTSGSPCTLTLSVTVINPSCNGGTNGTATATPGGGTGAYSYAWNGGTVTQTRGGLAAGTYTVTVTDANSCTISGNVTLTNPAGVTSTVTSFNPSCNGCTDGSATVTPGGGTSPYTYLWSNASTVASVTSLGAGTYTVTVTDSKSCTSTDNIVISNPVALTVTDIEGNVYNTVTIGTQVWMKENLKVTKYRNGDAIPTTTSTSIPNDSTSKYQWAYNNDNNNVATYGRLYTWYAVTDNRNVCPAGWHVPSDAEWTTLTDYFGGETVAGGKMKETGTSHWNSPNTGADNNSGFTALPGGYRDSNGTFYFISSYGYWWSATEFLTTLAWNRTLNYSNPNANRYGKDKNDGFSVRCVRD